MVNLEENNCIWREKKAAEVEDGVVWFGLATKILSLVCKKNCHSLVCKKEEICLNLVWQKKQFEKNIL